MDARGHREEEEGGSVIRTFSLVSPTEACSTGRAWRPARRWLITRLEKRARQGGNFVGRACACERSSSFSFSTRSLRACGINVATRAA